MDQQNIARSGTLQRYCMSAIAEGVVQVGGGRTNSLIDSLPLPPLILQQVEGIYQYRRDLSVLLGWPPLDKIRDAGVPNTRPFCDHYCWTNERKIDRRATAAAQLERLNPATASPASIRFGIVLAATYCLKDQCLRLLPHWNSAALLPVLPDNWFASPDKNPMLLYWATAFGTLGFFGTLYSRKTLLFGVRPRREGSSDFWATVIESFWPMAADIGGDYMCYWSVNILGSATEYGHKSVVEFVWSHLEEDVRTLLVENIDFLKSVIRANEKEFLIEIFGQLNNNDDRRATVLKIVDEVCVEFKHGHNLEIFEYLLECIVADCTEISTEIARPLCKILSVIWDSLSPQNRARICNDYIDVLRYAIEFGFVELAMRIWIEETEEERQQQMVFRDECAAFRSSCAKGHLELVRVFWEWASSFQRCHMIESKAGDALSSAARNGHLSIVRYLWENADTLVANEMIDSHGINDVSLSQLIIAFISNICDDVSHELEDFLATLITTSSNGHEPIYPPAAMKAILVDALSLESGKALKALTKRARCVGDPSILRSIVGEFDDEQRARLYSKLATQEDVELCGLESVQIVTRLQPVAVRPVREHEANDDGEDDEDDEEEEYGGDRFVRRVLRRLKQRGSKSGSFSFLCISYLHLHFLFHSFSWFSFPFFLRSFSFSSIHIFIES